MQIEPGTALAHYEVVDLLGKGGMGEVYRAKDVKLGREVAIKILPDAFTKDTERLARFEREARVLASLDHSHIAAIHGFEEIDGVRFLVMQLAGGEDLSERLQREGPIAVDEAIEIAKQVAEALEAAHDQGIIHRDLKPANVKIDEDGYARILDFGLAKALETEESDEDFMNSPTMVRAATHAGVILGTAAYMSPEQARGKKVDKRTDVWAFGVLLWEMLTGRRPFGGETVSDTLASVLKEEPDWDELPADAPPSVRRVLKLCLEKHPKNRLHDIADARLILAGTFDGVSEEPESVDRPRFGNVWVERLVWLALGAIVAAIVIFFMSSDGAAETEVMESVPRVNLQRVTELAGPELDPTLSPDGRMVIYASAVAGNLDLYLLRVGGDRTIRLTDDPANDSQPAFSSDGERVAFRSERDGGGLFVMGSTGESVRRVTEDGFDPAWSPDGTMLVYSTEPAVNPYDRYSTAQLWTVEITSGRKTLLTEGDAVQPVWSPDGSRIAFWSNDGGQRDIKTIPVSGGEPTAVTADEPTDFSPVWSPDGRWLYFSSDRGGSMGLWRIGMRETGEPVGEPEPVVTGVESLGFMSLSGDGTRAAVMAYDSNFELAMFAVDPGAPMQAAEPVRVLRSPSASICSVSPDGTWLACRTAGVPEDLVLLSADGTEMRRLTSDLAKDRNAVWDPSGERLAFASTLSGEWRDWMIRTDGSDRLEIESDPAGVAVWSPDGKAIVTRGSTGAVSRFSVGQSDTPPERYVLPIDETDRLIFPAAWTSVGNRVALTVADAPGNAQIFGVLDLDTGAFSELDVEASGRGWRSIGGWFPDGRHLLLRTAQGAVVYDTETGRMSVVAPASDEAFVSLSHDGTLLLVETEVHDSDIWLLELE